jgi:alpha-L-fucosidase
MIATCRRLIRCAAAVGFAICFTANAPKSLAETEQPWMKPDPAALERWQAMRFGMFIHWGPVCLTHHEIGWSRGKETPIEKYDSLYKQFNPVKFNADEWVAVAKAAGMKYVVLTTKHHDGFSLWDTKFSEHNIMRSPFRRDVVRELAAACKKEGLAFGAYYSICDWYHPDYPLGSPGGKTKKPSPDMDRYNAFMKNQLAELLKSYGPLNVLWFDGEWEQPWTAERGADLYAFLRKLQPDLLINNRVSKARKGSKGISAPGQLAGDYDTPEQRIGGFSMDRPWESCMTISAHNHWAWGGPEDGVKPLAACLRMLIRAAGGDGNVLLNVGPTPEGVIEQCQVDRLKEIGEWLAKYGDSIYGTRGGPFKPGKNVAATRKGNKVFVHILAWPADVFRLPALPAKIVNSSVLTGGSATVKQTAAGIEIAVPQADRQEIDTIVVLELDRPAIELEPVTVSFGEPLTTGRKARASNAGGNFTADKAVDGDENSHWSTERKITSCWLEVDLGEPQTFDRAVIRENVHFGYRVKAFELQCRDGDAWKTFHRGASIGENLEVKFAPVTARIVRLNIIENSGASSIDEFQVFAALAGK